MKIRNLQLTFAVVLAFMMGRDVSADIVFNNFGASDTYDANNSFFMGASQQNQEVAFAFTVNSGFDYFLDSALAPIGFGSGVNQITLRIYDNAGGLPGTALEEVTLNGLPDFGLGEPPSLFEFAGTTLLQDGETYFLAGNTINDNSSILRWNFSLGDAGPVAIRNDGVDGGNWYLSGSNNQNGAFRINGTVAVPEPGSLSMITTAAIGLALLRPRRKRSIPLVR